MWVDGGYGWVHYQCGLVDCSLGGYGWGVVGEWMGVVDRGLWVEAVGGWMGYGWMDGGLWVD